MNQNNGCSECDFGWVYSKYIDTKTVRLRDGESRTIETEYEGAAPCPICNAKKAQLFSTAESREQLQEILKNQSPAKRLEAYRDEEDSKTRVL